MAAVLVVINVSLSHTHTLSLCIWHSLFFSVSRSLTHSLSLCISLSLPRTPPPPLHLSLSLFLSRELTPPLPLSLSLSLWRERGNEGGSEGGRGPVDDGGTRLPEAVHPPDRLKQGAGCRVQGSGCRVQGAGCRVRGRCTRPIAWHQQTACEVSASRLGFGVRDTGIAAWGLGRRC